MGRACSTNEVKRNSYVIGSKAGRKETTRVVCCMVLSASVCVFVRTMELLFLQKNTDR
jgi:hypothetical protein